MCARPPKRGEGLEEQADSSTDFDGVGTGGTGAVNQFNDRRRADGCGNPCAPPFAWMSGGGAIAGAAQGSKIERTTEDAGCNK